MNQLVIEDLDFLSKLSDPIMVNGGVRRSARASLGDLDADLDADLAASLEITGHLGGYLTVQARGSAAAAAAAAVVVGPGRARAVAYAQA